MSASTTGSTITDRILALRLEGRSLREIAAETGVSKSTVGRYVKASKTSLPIPVRWYSLDDLTEGLWRSWVCDHQVAATLSDWQTRLEAKGYRFLRRQCKAHPHGNRAYQWLCTFGPDDGEPDGWQ